MGSTHTQQQYWTEAQRHALEEMASFMEVLVFFYSLILPKFTTETSHLLCLLGVMFLSILMAILMQCQVIGKSKPWRDRIQYWVAQFFFYGSLCSVSTALDFGSLSGVFYCLWLIVHSLLFTANVLFLACYMDRRAILVPFFSVHHSLPQTSSSFRINDAESDNEENVGRGCNKEAKGSESAINSLDFEKCKRKNGAMFDNWYEKSKKRLLDLLALLDLLKSCCNVIEELGKKLKRAEDAQEEDQRKWETQKVDLTVRLFTAEKKLKKIKELSTTAVKELSSDIKELTEDANDFVARVIKEATEECRRCI